MTHRIKFFKFAWFGIKILLVVAALFLSAEAILVWSMIHGTPRDVVAELGEGKYELGWAADDLVLSDHRFHNNESGTLVTLIEKYTIEGNRIYVVGDFTDSYCTKVGEHSPHPCEYEDFATGEYIYYKPGEPVPRFTILDFKNDRLRTYVKLEDVPPEDQAVFEKAKTFEGAAEKRDELLNRKLP
jgi:hypothetical protein